MRRVGAMARTIWRLEPATVITRCRQTTEMVACMAEQRFVSMASF